MLFYVKYDKARALLRKEFSEDKHERYVPLQCLSNLHRGIDNLLFVFKYKQLIEVRSTESVEQRCYCLKTPTNIVELLKESANLNEPFSFIKLGLLFLCEAKDTFLLYKYVCRIFNYSLIIKEKEVVYLSYCGERNFEMLMKRE